MKMQINYDKELNPEQLRAVKTTEGPLLILAVAGAGKTRTLIYRVAYLIENGVSPESVLLLTFTNRAADEMKERASKILDDRCSMIEACTYHSFCVKILRQYGSRTELDRHFTILSGSDQTDVIKIARDRLKIDHSGDFPDARGIISLISASVNRCTPIPDLLMTEEFTKMLPWQNELMQIADEYQKYKSERGFVDFDDMLLRFIDLLKRCPDIREKLDRKYRYIMVDEYQDSNKLQEEMLLLMRQDNKNLAVVGDDMQSLYAFRGADVGNILHFPDRMPGCNTVILYHNYRSNQEILDLSNAVVKNNATEGIYKEMKGTYSAGYRPKVVHVADNYTQSRYVLDEIKRLRQSGLNGTPVKLSDIAVLQRNSVSSAALESDLSRMHIPYVKYGGTKFMDSAHVRDILAFWKCLANDRNDIAWYRILKLFPGISNIYSQNISSNAGTLGENILVEHMYKSHRFASLLAEFKNTYDSWKQMSYPDVLDATIEYYKGLLIDHIDRMTKDKEDKDLLKKEVYEKTDSLSVFTDMADEYKSLSEFVDALTLEPPDENRSGEGDDMLTISTIHSAKGLEYPVVFILDCADGAFPRNGVPLTGAEEQKDNEELRCMYVAMTRAKNMLYLMAPQSGYKYGRAVFYEQSHFLTGTEHLRDDEFVRRYTRNPGFSYESYGRAMISGGRWR